jgi:hypothetical protein
MFEKILQKLKEQRGTNSSVSDRSLEDLAKSWVPFITTEEVLGTVDFTPMIKTIEGNINHNSAEAAKKAAEDAKKLGLSKKEQDEAAKKAAEDAEKAKNQGGTGSDEPPAWAKKIMDDISSLKTEKLTGSRIEKLNASLKDVPKWFSNPILSGFQNTSFENEEAFDAYLKNIETNRDAFQLAAKEQGLNTTLPLNSVKLPKEDGQTPLIADAREIVNKAKEKQQKQTT